MTHSLMKNLRANTRSKPCKIKQVFIFSLLALFGLAGCSSTTQHTIDEVNPVEQTRINSVCLQQVDELKGLKKGSASQYLMLADLSLSCIQTTDFPARHQDSQKAMQLFALSFVNYVKAGDVQAAQETLERFKQTFPQQDLLFADYTSFIDTATALLSHQNMTDGTLALLNINKSLRDELVRKRTWALN